MLVESQRSPYGYKDQAILDLTSTPIYYDVSLNEEEKIKQKDSPKVSSRQENEFEEEHIDLNKLWNLCIQGNEYDTSDEAYKTVCCSKSIDDRKFYNGGAVIFVIGAGSAIVASFFNNIPVIVIGAIAAAAGLMTACVPPTKSCCRKEEA